MNRRKFFAGLAAAPVATVAGAASASAQADERTLPWLSPSDLGAIFAKHENNPTFKIARHVDEVVGKDGVVRRNWSVGHVYVDGKVIGYFTPDERPGYFRESDITEAYCDGRITGEMAYRLRIANTGPKVRT